MMLRSRVCARAVYGRRMASVVAAPQAAPQGYSQTKLAEATMKRFWKKVGIERRDLGLTVTLDAKPLKTPGAATLVLPAEKERLARLIAAEWSQVSSASMRQHQLPLTSLAARAVDHLDYHHSDRGTTIASLLRYLDTDAVLIHTPGSDRFQRMQDEEWTPVRRWAESFLGVPISHLAPDSGLVSHRQTDDTRRAARHYLDGLDKWELAAFERSVYATKSFLLAALLVESQRQGLHRADGTTFVRADGTGDALGVEEIATLATLEVRYQTDLWGEVEDTHDVDFHDIRRQLASAVLLLS